MIKKTHNYLRQRFYELSHKATELKNKLDSSKTQLKKDYYLKKLKRNNEQAADIIQLLGSARLNQFHLPPVALDTKSSGDSNVI